MNTKNVKVPGWLWWATLVGVITLSAIMVLGAIILASGAADPPVAGPIVWSDVALAWTDGTLSALAPAASVWFTAPDAARLPPDRFTLEVAANITPESDPGTAWGVWLETEAGDRVLYAISGEGYTTTRRCDATLFADFQADAALQPAFSELDCPALRPAWRWMPYPRIYSPGTANTITLHVEATTPGGSEVRLRLNREIMGAAAIRWSGRWGVWLRGGRAAGASGVAGSIVWQNATVRGN